MIVLSKIVVPKGFRSITLFPFIFLSHKTDKMDNTLINHEKIHLRQQAECLIIPFFIWYVVEFLIRYVACGNNQQAYRTISFEKEAYQNENDPNYLQKRKFGSFTKYL